MDKESLPSYKEIHTIIFDFDGVYTDNKVFLSQDGQEIVQCDRSDGLAFDILRAFKKQYNWEIRYFVLSTETNKVVKMRCKKLGIKCYQGVTNKLDFLRKKLQQKINSDPKGVIYLGNDLNDLGIMKYVGWPISPLDAHPMILSQAKIILPRKGGSGVVRYLIEELIGLNKDKSLLEELGI